METHTCFEFTVRYVEADGRHYYTAREAPVVGMGATREEAAADMQAALSVWVDSLAKVGQLERAVTEGRLPIVITVSNPSA